MADRRPSAAPMFTSYTDLAAERTEDTGTDEIIMHPGANQFIPQSRNHFTPVTARSNRVQAGQLPRTSGPTIGLATPSNPLGRGSSTSLED